MLHDRRQLLCHFPRERDHSHQGCVPSCAVDFTACELPLAHLKCTSHAMRLEPQPTFSALQSWSTSPSSKTMIERPLCRPSPSRLSGRCDKVKGRGEREWNCHGWGAVLASLLCVLMLRAAAMFVFARLESSGTCRRRRRAETDGCERKIVFSRGTLSFFFARPATDWRGGSKLFLVLSASAARQSRAYVRESFVVLDFCVKV